MSSSLHRWSRRFWVVTPLLLGFVLVWAAPKAQSGPSPSENQERPVKVRVIQVTPLEASPRLVGYGLVRAARTWEAVAEVAALVVWLAESARSGLIVPEGTELIRLDDADYRLTLAQVEAQLKADYLSKQDLASKGSGAQNKVDAAERQMLNGLSQVQNLKHALDLGDAEHELLAATLSSLFVVPAFFFRCWRTGENSNGQFQREIICSGTGPDSGAEQTGVEEAVVHLGLVLPGAEGPERLKGALENFRDSLRNSEKRLSEHLLSSLLSNSKKPQGCRDHPIQPLIGVGVQRTTGLPARLRGNHRPHQQVIA
jgi:hypothetical protein